MYIAYLAVTSLAALMNAFAACMNFAGAKFVKAVADKVQVSPKWMVPFGILLAAGAVGLMAGFAVPTLGAAAVIGLVVYFICALGAHVRVRDRNVGGAITFLVLAVAALVTDVGYHQHL
jgi:DoxX-like family